MNFLPLLERKRHLVAITRVVEPERLTWRFCARLERAKPVR